MERDINKDIRDYTVKDMGPFTFKQALSLAIGTVCGGFTTYLLRSAGYLSMENISTLEGQMMLLPVFVTAAPALFFGFYKNHGLSAWQLLKIFVREQIMTPKVLVYKSSMTYNLEDFLEGEELEEYIEKYQLDPKAKKKKAKKTDAKALRKNMTQEELFECRKCQ